jgi:exodeoxyribonuclease-5
MPAPGRNRVLRSAGNSTTRLPIYAAGGRNPSPYYLLEGFAGTGKTTLVTSLARELGRGISFIAPTGKAASVLRRKGASGATTIHRFLYEPPIVTIDADGNEVLIWERREDLRAGGLIVADECSMIDQRVGHDLLALMRPGGCRLLITGDPFQLLPINGKPFFADDPDFTLTEIHRQAQNSQPLELAVNIYNGERIRPGKFDLDLLLQADIVIVALHATRRQINHM